MKSKFISNCVGETINMITKETLKKSLLGIVDAIDAGHTNYTEEELCEILDSINKATNTQNKLSKEQACKYLGVSRATFDNRVREGIIPQGRKEVGFKEKFWLKEDLCNTDNN